MSLSSRCHLLTDGRVRNGDKTSVGADQIDRYNQYFYYSFCSCFKTQLTIFGNNNGETCMPMLITTRSMEPIRISKVLKIAYIIHSPALQLQIRAFKPKLLRIQMKHRYRRGSTSYLIRRDFHTTMFLSAFLSF